MTTENKTSLVTISEHRFEKDLLFYRNAFIELNMSWKPEDRRARLFADRPADPVEALAEMHLEWTEAQREAHQDSYYPSAEEERCSVLGGILYRAHLYLASREKYLRLRNREGSCVDLIYKLSGSGPIEDALNAHCQGVAEELRAEIE